ncbi:MAG: DUF885 domain-containing protein [Bryobacteraceae bacterium]|nr:DUF885 domain-containing protein [Bryobacteraceae bacterium]
MTFPRRALVCALLLTLPACKRGYYNLESHTSEFAYTVLSFSPVMANAAGFHRFAGDFLDEMLDDFSESALNKQRKFYHDFDHGFRKIPRERISPQDQADYDLILDQIKLSLLELEVIKSYKHNPTIYVESLGNAFFTPYSLTYSREDLRFYSIIRRLETVPKFMVVAKRNLVDSPEIWNRVAREENLGNIALIDGPIRTACPKKLRDAYDKAAKVAIDELKSFNTWLETDLSQRTSDWRLGAEHYAKKFPLVLANGDTPQGLLADAEAELVRVRAEMAKIAGKEGVKPMLNRIAQAHPSREAYFETAAKDLAETTQFVRDRQSLTLRDTSNLKVIETPEFMRGIYSVGGFNPAPVLHPELRASYWLTPIPANWPADRVESKLREYNTQGLALLTIHEAMPGHYVQSEVANLVEPRGRRVLRNIFGNGPAIEGWAVYATQMLLEQGYRNHSPELQMTFLKQQLRMIANTILDIRLHTMNMTDEQAMKLMLEDTYQEQEEATGKLQRAKLSSVQLPTYFAGWRAIVKMRDRQSKLPGFNLRKFHDDVLGMGALPVPAIERLLNAPAAGAPPSSK